MADSYSVRAVLGCIDKGFSSGLKAASKTTDSLVSKFKSGFSFGAWAAAGASAFRTVTGGITGLAKGIVQSGMEFESTMSTVKAISGATSDEMDRLTNLAKEMGATTKFTATESAEALKYMGMAGWDAGQMISGLPGILNLAAAGETDLGATSDIVTDGLSAFGLKAEDAAHFSDALAAAVTSTNTDVLMMGETFKYVGPVCGSLGTSMEDTAIAAGLMAGQGVKASQAGTSLRRGLQNLIAPTKPVAAAMEKYGVAIATTADGQLDLLGTIKNVRSALSGMSDVERTAAVSAIFGAEAQTGWNAIIKTSDEEFQRVTESIYGCEGAAQKMADIKMDNLAGDVTLFQSAWDGVRQTLYDMEKGPLRSVVQLATEAMTALNDCIANGTSFASAISQVDGLGTALKGIGGAAGVASAAIGAISISNFMKDSGAIEKVDSTLKHVSNSFSTLKNKVGGFSFDKFAKKGRSSFAKMGKRSRDLGKAFDTFGGKIALSMDAISPKLSDAGLKIWDSFNGVGRKISTSGSDLAKKMRKSFKGATDAVSEVISRVSTIAAPFKDVISKVGGVVTSVGGKMTSGLTSMIGLAMKLLAPTALAGAALAGLGLLYSQFGSQIDSIIQMVSEKGPQIISNFANGITGKLPSLIAAGAQMLSGLMNAISANIPAIIQAGVSVVGALVQGVGNSLGTLIPAAIGLVSSLVSGILSALPQLITTGMNLLLALVQGIVNNLPLIINSAMVAIMAFINGASSAMPNILNTAVQIIQTLITGLIQNLPTIIANGFQIVGALISGIVQNFPSIVSAGWDIIVSLGQGLLEAIPAIITGIVDGISGLFSDLWNFITGGAEDASASIESKTKEMAASLSTNTSAAKTAVGTDAWAMAGSVSSACSSFNVSGATNSLSALSSCAGAETGAVVNDAQTMASAANAACSNIDTSGAVSQYENLAGSVDSTISSINNTSASGLKEMQSSYSTTIKGINKTVSTGMNDIARSIQSGGNRAATIAKQAASSIVTAFRSAHSGAYSAGRYIGQGLVSGLASTLGQVRSMAASIAAAADKAIRAKAKISSPSKVTTKDGKYIGLGLVVGMKRLFGAVYSAGVRLAAMASKGIVDEAEIHSPSRKAEKHGVNVGQGFANGLLASFKTVRSAAKSLAKTAFDALQSTTGKKVGGFSTAASAVSNSYKKSLTSSMNAQLSSMKKKLNGAIKKNKSVKKALNAAYKQYSKYLKDAVDKAISKTKDRLDDLGEAYQKKYEAFRDRLREYGDMLTVDKYGYVALKNFDEMTNQIKALGSNLEKLKRWNLSQNFMEEIAGMDTASALAMTNELLSRGEAAAVAYGKSYDKAMSAASSVSDKFYQSYFNAGVKKELASLQSNLNTIGKNAMEGFVKGMNSKAKSLKGASKKLALSIVSTFKKYLKIHSPSKVFATLGRYIGAGLINGLERIAGKVQSATENLVTLPDIRVPTPALATPGGSLAYSGVSEGLTQVPESEYVIIVPVELDGKEVARVTAPYTQRELNKLENREGRKRGVR